jgi:predicted GNAT superfamily acetyltransferase
MPDDLVLARQTRETRERADSELAVAALHPQRFGLHRHRDGWRKTFPGLGEVVFAPLGWQHAQCPSYDCTESGTEPLDALAFLVRLQARVWGMSPEDLVPVNILAILPDTGGSVIVAYREDLGFNADGWVGFVIAAGGRSGTLVSHMLGVREDQRGTRDLGWHLKLLQGYEALRAGHRSATWTFDPMRGANARLNLEKLGATVRELTLDKYGALRSELYGDVPSDRFTAHWDLLAAATHRRIDEVRTGLYAGPDPAWVNTLPEVTTENAALLVADARAAVRYRIPADVDALMNEDLARANAWRSEMRAALAPFMTIKSARVAEKARADLPGASDPAAPASSPIDIRAEIRPGAYDVVAFASDGQSAGDRENWYVLRRRGGEG